MTTPSLALNGWTTRKSSDCRMHQRKRKIWDSSQFHDQTMTQRPGRIIQKLTGSKLTWKCGTSQWPPFSLSHLTVSLFFPSSMGKWSGKCNPAFPPLGDPIIVHIIGCDKLLIFIYLHMMYNSGYHLSHHSALISIFAQENTAAWVAWCFCSL